MSYQFGLGDVAYLASAEAEGVLRELRGLELRSETRIGDVARARALAGERFGAVLETLLLRRKAAAKFAEPWRWLLTEEALQQATALPVAKHRARRLRARAVHDVTCSIGADLAWFGPGSFGSDLDEVRLAMARHNCPETPLLRADALRPVSRDVVVFADPARREGGKRKWHPDQLRPPLGELAEAYAGRDLVVKCSPGLDMDALPFESAEVEVVSLDRQAREACLWTGATAEPGVQRRASVLSGDGLAYSLTDAQPDDCPVTEAGTWLVDPDPAVIRAGLVRQYAYAHGLAQLDERIAYLTGDLKPEGARAFRVREQLPFTEKRLRSALRSNRIGRVEILTRGVNVDPDALRAKLKPSGPEGCSVLITRIGTSAVAFLCDPD